MKEGAGDDGVPACRRDSEGPDTRTCRKQKCPMNWDLPLSLPSLLVLSLLGGRGMSGCLGSRDADRL